MQVGKDEEDARQQEKQPCAICGNKSCTRHQEPSKEELVLVCGMYLVMAGYVCVKLNFSFALTHVQPWEGLMVPKVVDDSVTEVRNLSSFSVRATVTVDITVY